MGKIATLHFTPQEANQRVRVSGKTFHVRNELKSVGGVWDPATTSWTIPFAAYSTVLRDELNALVRKILTDQKADAARQKAFAASPEGIAAAKEQEKQRVIDALKDRERYFWICCEDCRVLSWQTKHTACKTHAPGATMLCGRIYTGD